MKVNAFSKSYDGRVVLHLPPLEFVPGRIYAVIGANGSGKSTLAKILAGVVPADRERKVLSKPVCVGYMPQKSYAFRMSTRSNIRLAAKDSRRADELMKALRIDHLSAQRAGRLSGGETARMALARLLMKPYETVILDEPTAAMDIESTALAEALMVRYCREQGCAMIVVTHSLQQAQRIADEVLFLHQGELAEAGPAEKVLYTPENPETKRFLKFYGAL